MTGILRDITVRKRMEEIIRKSHAELELLVEERTKELMAANVELRREIEERRRAEQELRGSESRFRSIVETAGDHVSQRTRS